jgi:hypothetical protein
MLIWYRLFLDKLTRNYTADATFQELIEGPENYNPSIYWHHYPERHPLAVSFDREQRKRGSRRRVWPELPETVARKKLSALSEANKLYKELEVLSSAIDSHSAPVELIRCELVEIRKEIEKRSPYAFRRLNKEEMRALKKVLRARAQGREWL